jgi:hypothetical protein
VWSSSSLASAGELEHARGALLEPARCACAHFAITTAQGDAAGAGQRAVRLRQLSGVRSVTLNRVCGTLRVQYDRSSVSASELARAWTQGEGGAEESDRCPEGAIDCLRSLQMLARVARALAAT